MSRASELYKAVSLANFDDIEYRFRDAPQEQRDAEEARIDWLKAIHKLAKFLAKSSDYIKDEPSPFDDMHSIGHRGGRTIYKFNDGSALVVRTDARHEICGIEAYEPIK